MHFINETKTDDATIERAVDEADVARGVYQEAVLSGIENWTGSTLRGKASQYGARYAKSRGALLYRIDAAVEPLGLVAESALRLLPAYGGARRWQRVLVIMEGADECSRCGGTLSDHESAMGWPIADGADYVCPECYGEAAFCRCGEVLRGDEESDRCASCEEGAR